MFDTLSGQIGAFFMVAVCLFAFLKGDELERIGAGVYLFGWFASLLVQHDGELYQVQYAVFAIDLVVLLVFGAMAWKSRRAWPAWACALQLLGVMSHVLAFFDIRPSISSYYAVLNIASYGILVAIGLGTFWAWQERRAAGLE